MTCYCTDTPEPQSPQLAEVQISDGVQLKLSPFGLEHVRAYEPDGLHPIHLGDLLQQNERYNVIHKLGHGGFATVWLCRDLESESYKYVALKVLTARASTDDCAELRVNKLEHLLGNGEVGVEHVCLPTDHFRTTGPNGQHHCFVYPVLGPKASEIVHSSANSNPVLRRIAHQAVQALAALHKHGIAMEVDIASYNHVLDAVTDGILDFTPANIPIKLSGLQGLTEEDVMNKLEEPWRNPVLNASGEPCNEATAPQYLVYPIDFNVVGEDLITDNACVTDLGESFEIKSPPKYLGIPKRYQSPEYLLDQQVGIESDLWALGCSLFQFGREGTCFDPFDDDVDDIIRSQVLKFGKMPEPWWTTCNARIYFEDDADAVKSDTASNPDLEPSHEDRSVLQALSRGLSYVVPMGSSGRVEWVSCDRPEGEVELLADLLEKILKWKPNERLSAEEVLTHAWFKM